MAKKQKTEEAADQNVETTEESPKAQKERKALKDHFTFLTEVDADGNEIKLPPQAKGILNILKAAKKKGLSRENLVAAMDGVIETRQPLGRILSYYQKKLVECGAVDFVKFESEEG